MHHGEEGAPERANEDARAALLARLRKGRAPATPGAAAIPRRADPTRAPLSHAQQRLWFLQQLHPESAAYNMVNEYRLRGALDVAALQRALDDVVRRHEALRTRFVVEDGEPVQVVDPPAAVPLPLHDLSALPADEREAARRDHERDETTSPVSLRDGPVLRARLLRLAADDHALLVAVHHACFDEWSELRFTQELAHLYDAHARGVAPTLPEPRIQYGDYAAWQRGSAADEALARQLDHWRRRLVGLAPLDLPTDRPRPATLSDRGRMHAFRLSADLTERLHDLCRREDVTLFMALLAGFKALLHRHSGARDVVVGSPITGRTRAETEDVIGFFVNTLALRDEVDPDMSFRALLQRVKATCLEAYANQDVPFERVVEAVQPERDPSRTPVFQVLFSLQQALARAPRAQGLDIAARFVESPTSKFDLSLYMLDDAQGMRAWLEYATDLFDEGTARRLGERLAALLESACAAPGRAVGELDLLPVEERDLVTRAWSVRGGEPPVEPVHRTVARRAQEAPDHVAVEGDGVALTYGELHARALRLARRLRALGVRDGAPVGLSVARGPGMVVGLLGILEAGGAYLPLDPAYPRARLAQMLEESNARLVVADARAALPDTGVAFVRVEAEDAPDVALPEASLDHDAYVLFTSGSTGRPKGTPIRHGSLANLVDAMRRELDVRADDVLLGVTTLSFDIGTLEVLLPLTTGARLVLVPTEVAKDPQALLPRLDEATLMQATPATWRMLVEAGWPAGGRTRERLRVLSGGEPLAPDLARALLERAAGVWNGYGPTETTIYSTLHRVERVDGARVPIGRPLANTRVLVLDARGHPAPVGVPGELCIGGLGVSRGYLLRPELTAEKFVADSLAPGERTYRTGDLVRWRADGTLDFLGRLDRQVKVRGFRIELGEVEAALLEAPGVRQAVVAARADASGTARLVAYVTGDAVDADGVRAALRARLPEHMVPSIVVRLDALPLTPNGKVDHRALPEPQAAVAAAAEAPSRALTPTEETVAEAWRGLLRVPRVGPQDDFFSLGGHSLLAARMALDVRERLGRDVPLRHLFAAPTLEGFAARLDTEAGAPAVAAPRALPTRDGVPLSPAQRRMWFLQQLAPMSSAYNMTFRHDLEGPLDAARLQRALERVVARHEALRTTVELSDGEPVQRVHAPGPVPMPVEDVADEAALDRLAHEEARRPFDLHAGPVLRARLARLAPARHALLVSVHHVAFDERSAAVFLEELAALYDADDASALPLPALQQGDLAEWQRARLDGGAIDRLIAHWGEHLRGVAPLELPTDRPRAAAAEPPGAHLPLTLPPRVVERLRTLAREEGATLFMALLALYEALLHRHTGAEDFAVGAPVAGRAAPGAERAVGVFLNTVALRADLSGDPSLRALLRRVRDACRDAFAHDEAPFDDLVAALHPERGAARTPFFQTFFSLQGADASAPRRIGEARLSTRLVPTPTAKFDLSLYLQESDAGIRGTVEYRADLFDASRIERMARQLARLAEAAVAAPEAPLSALDLLPADEAALLRRWGENREPAPQETLLQLFRRQVARAPDALAVEAADAALTYAQLARRADALARRLRDAGAGPGARVAVALDRSSELVASLLAVLQTGAAYVPLDPSHPPARVAAIIEDAGIQLALAQRGTDARLPAGLTLVRVDEASAVGDDGPFPEPSREAPAYAIYTSGSTGVPKGVVVPHGALANVVDAFRRELDLGPGDRWVAVTTVSFDIAALELLAPLVAGAAVVLATRDEAADPRALARRLEGADILQATPATWRSLVESGWHGNPRLRALVGGEALPPDLARDLLARVGSLRNVYGPTETTIWSTVHRVDAVEGARVPIGRPLGATTLRVLDRHGRLAPVGVPGELHIGGAGVALGYFGRPDLTTEKFVPDPLQAGARLYRTGDLAQWREDGTLDFLGRADHQLKVRGFRVEAGEVETRLMEVAPLREAAVIARDERLVAYVVPREDALVDVAAARERLAQALPDYMVPARFVVLDGLPLTPNGKVDRKRLPAPDADARDALTGAYFAPRTALEEALVEEWRDALRVERVGVEDDFFALGGHSLLATRLVSRWRERTRVELPLRAFFATPTVGGLARALEAAGVRFGHEAAAPARGDDAAPALSPGQERMLFLHRLDPQSAAYNMAVARRLRGPLDVDALRAALADVVARHAPLRTTFRTEGEARAVVAPPAPVDVPVLDAPGGTPEARERAALEAARVEAHRPFDLERGPVFRARLWRVDAEDHLLLLGVHHVAFDEWSEAVLLDDLATCYRARARGISPALPPLSRTYAEHARRQRERSGDAGHARDVAWWRERLAGLEPLELPADRPRPAQPTHVGHQRPLRVDARAAARLRDLCREEGATPFMGLLAAYQALLHRYTGRDDIAVGAPVSGRGEPGAERLVGFCVNTLVLRGDLTGAPTFRELVRRTRGACLEAFAHQDVPFEQLVEDLAPARGLDRTPLFQTAFLLQESPATLALDDALRASPVALQGDTAKFDLTLALSESRDGALDGFVEASGDLFDAATADRIGARFARLLQALAETPDEPVARAPLLTDDEARALETWSGETAAVEGPATFHGLVEAQARLTPDAEALRQGEESLTYRELDERAAALARRLLALGVRPGDRVGLCARRRPSTIVAILGILKSGGAYLPLDPAYPRERLQLMIDDARPCVLVTETEAAGALPDTSGIERVFLDAAPADAHEAERDLPNFGGSDLAYVIYTSGSTGKPKGVLLEHAGAVNLAAAQRALFGIAPGDRVLQFAPLSFDASVWEILMALASGATLCLPPPDARLAGDELQRALDDDRVTVATLPPTALATLSPEGLDALHTLVVAGEACPPHLVARWSRGRRFVNAYGPTETTVCATAFVCGGAEERALPIGRPLLNVRVRVLDARGAPVPVGVPGELHVGGIQLARGYHERPDLTREKFVPDPLAPGERLYRTGDLARWLPSGDLEFLGRIDTQVKVRGFRIELGEIEAGTLSHPGVREAAVVVREDAPGDKRIVAYYVPEPADGATSTSLREHLAARLPAHMVPSALVALDALPLTPNGKVDRKALPALSRQRADAKADDEKDAPRSPREAALVAIWKDVLGVERVGVHDNFFELGGDSILSIQVVARANQQRIRLTTRQVFDHQTVAALAAALPPEPEVDAEQGEVVGEAPLTPIERWFFARDLPERHHWNQSVLLELAPDVEPSEARAALAAILAHHDALRLRFARDVAGAWRQEIAPASAVAELWFHAHDLSSERDAEARERAFVAACERAQASLDLARGGLLRAEWFHLGESEAPRLLLAVHHLAVDGVSWRILLEDFRAALAQVRAGTPVRLPPKTTSFLSWSRRLAAHARTSEALRAELDRWRGEADGARLPRDHPEGANDTESEETVEVELTPAQTQALLRDVPKAYAAHVHEALLGALAHALVAWTGSSRAFVEVEGHGREELFPEVDLSRTVGWFTTLHPLLVDLADAGVADPAAAVAAAKRALRAVPRHGIGHGLLMHLGPDDAREALAGLPEPEVAFNYLGRFDRVGGGDGLLRISDAPHGRDHARSGTRHRLVEVNGLVLEDRLAVRFGYSARIHERGTIERLASAFRDALARLVDEAHVAAKRDPADFPLARLDRPTLDRLLEGREGRVQDIYPLSPMQQGMLFHTLREPDSGVYLEQSCHLLDGDVDAAALEEAWRRLVERHDMLRAGFAWDRLEAPLQVVHRHAPLPFRVLDWTGADDDEQERRLAAFLDEDRAAGIDLAKPPLLRVALVRLSRERAWMILTNHHVLLDGWSLPILLRELGVAYHAALAGRAPELPPVRPYADFIARLRARDPAHADAYWRGQLAGFDEPTPLAADRPAPREAGREERVPGKVTRALSPEATERLQSLARAARVTTGTLLQGAWALLLSRYSGRDDVLFGATTSGRVPDLDGVESMVGLFINTVPVRVRVPADEPAREWLRRLQGQQAELREHEHTPLVEAQRATAVPPGTPLFESILVFENYPWGEERGDALPVRDIRTVSRTNYPLTVVAGTTDRLHLVLHHDLARLDRAAVERMATHLERLLLDLAERPDAPLADLRVLPEAEARLLESWETARAPPEPVLAHELVLAQARRTPSAVAIEDGRTRLTYAQLDAESARLARGLRAAGVRRGDRVAITMEPGVEPLVAILATMRAGAAYLPVDPAYPEARRAYLLADGAPRLVLTQAALRDAVPPTEARVLTLDEARALADAADAPPDASLGADDLAYVIYTSGSTGHPKGVIVPHRGASALALAQAEAFALGVGDRVLQFASLSFDASFWELMMTLACGATLVVPPARVAGEELQRLIAEAGITAATLPPSALKTMDPGALPGLRVVVAAGEELPRDVAARWREGRRFFNAYGPTEATVCATIEEVTPDAERAPTIGRPFAATRVLLLDARLRRVPVGVPGEICLGGPGLAHGYHGKPDLTAQRFVACPYQERERLYRTGDLARWMPDGRIEFLGRIDTQVKVRGFRIECGEVEDALVRHEAVSEALVTARPDRAGEARLVAYFVAPDARPSAGELREWLAASLPAHMVPTAFVQLEAFPLTPNGKIDRKALPDPDGARVALATAYVAPRDPVEEIVAGIWARVLGVPRVGARDDFFELGGHSLMATQVASRLRAALDVEVPLRTLFVARTVEQLADEVRRLRADGAGLALPPVVRGESADGRAPLSFSQQRLWFLDQWEPESAVYNIPAFYRLRGPLDPRALEASLHDLVRRHEVLRTVYRVGDDGHPYQQVLPAARLSLDPVDLGHLPPLDRETEARRIADEQARAPFDLAEGPVFRARLVRLAREEHWLLLAFHHIAFDGWSMGVFLHELGELYKARAHGLPDPLPPPALQYADFARWQRAHLDEKVLEAQLRHWREALAGLEPLDLPTDKPRPRVQSFRGAQVPFELSPRLRQRLADLAREEGVTPFMPLLAAFQLLLHRHTRQEDVAVGSPIAGRTRGETEGMLGFFVNTLVLRAGFGEDPTFRALLRQVRDACLDAYANQDVPFERLVAQLAPQRDTSRSPLFQAMFVLQEEALSSARWADIDVTGLPVESTAAKFDLTLWMANHEDRLVGTLEYRTDLFETETVARMATHLEALLEHALAEPDAPVSRLRLMPPDERARALEAAAGPAMDVPDAPGVHALVEAHARARPEAVAVRFEGRETTYGELDARAERICAALAARGVRPGDRVAVLLERGDDMPAAFLGVLKANAVYVPLDPRHPEERLAFVLRDSGARALLTRAPKRDAVRDFDDAGLLVESLDDAPTTAPSSGDGTEGRFDRVAYILYTSGSTGVPKGVLVEHPSLLSFSLAFARAMGIGEGTRVLQFAPPAFDGVIAELAGTLVAGGCLCFPASGSTLTGDDLARDMRDARIEVAVVSPAALGTLAPQELPDLRVLGSAGDVLPAAVAQAWASRVDLRNVYGPTETTVGATMAPVAPGVATTPTIGRPFANVRAYVLDRHLEPVPFGVPGELCVGGAGVSRGYLARPELTAERFVDDPHAPGGRLYRTGDLARMRADGDIEFLGRLDDQVKIRGFRVEPGEVASALLRHPDVRDAAVVAREERGEKRLVAYLVLREGAALDVSDMRRFLLRAVPDHFVPAHFVALDALPLTRNQKLDRKALPAPTPAAAREHVAPRTPLERALSKVWAEVLGAARVGVTDNFFDLGGDSILSIRVIALARREGIHMEPKQLFEHQTVEALAAALDDERAPVAPRLVTLRAGDEASLPLFLVHPAGGSVAPYARLARALDHRGALLALSDDEGAAGGTLAQLAARHLDDVRARQPHGPYALGGWSLGALLAQEMARQLEAAGEEIALLALVDPTPPEASDGEREALRALLAPEMVTARDPRLLRQLGLDEGAPDDSLRARLDVFARHLEARRSHAPHATRAPALLVLADATVAQIPALESAWRRLLGPDLDVLRLPGEHHTLLADDETVAVLATRLSKALQAASPGGDPP